MIASSLVRAAAAAAVFALAACDRTASPAPTTPSTRAASVDAPRAAHRIVFELAADGRERWDALLNNVDNVRKALGPSTTSIEVVAHAKGLGVLLAANEAMQDRMKQLADAGVVFAACENTMRKQGVSNTDLMPFVRTVDSGVAELVRKQEGGWSYLKAGE